MNDIERFENLQTTIKLNPKNFQARRELSILLAKNGFNEEALSNLEYLSKYFPEDSEIWYNIGILQEKLRQPNKAKDSYLKAIEISAQDDYLYNLGEVLVELQEWDDAIVAFKSVLKNDPNDGNCYFNLGICHMNKDESNLAIDFLQKAIEFNPKDIFAHFYLGNLYQNNGLTNFAEECFHKVLEISPDYSWAYYNLASIAYKNENLDDAKNYLIKTIEFNDMDIEAYKLLTKICIKQNEIEEIITILQTRLKKEGNGDLFYMLAQVYRHIGEKPQYAHCLEMALKNNLTLSFSKNDVKIELEYVQKTENLKSNEFEEYTSRELEDNDFEDFNELDEDEENKEDSYEEDLEENYEDDEDFEYLSEEDEDEF